MREVYRFGPYRLDVDARRLTRLGEPVQVTLRGFELLLVLVRNAGKAVPRSRLLEEVWRDVVVEEGNLDTHVSALRKALARAPGAIETVRGFGYRFAAPLEVEIGPGAELDGATPGAPPAAIAAEAPAADLAETTAGGPSGLRSRRRTLVGTVAGILALATLITVGSTIAQRRAVRQLERPAAATGVPTLAVLPFGNLSRSADHAWLATALPEVLASEIGRVDGVDVLPGETVGRVASEVGLATGTTVAAATLARFRDRLGADLVVSGSYLVVGSARELRLDLRLYDARTGRSRLVGSELGTVDGLLPVVARAGDALRTELGQRVRTRQDDGSAYSESEAALRHYATGLERLRAWQPAAALAALEQAVAADPAFALARGALADVLGQLGRERQAREEARRALELAGSLPELERLRLEGRLFALTQQWPRAVEIQRRLASASPAQLDDGLALARALTRANEPAAAVAELDRLTALPAPKGADPRIDLERGWAARAAADFEAMLRAGERTVAKGRALDSELVVAEGLVLVSWADLTLGRLRDGLVACAEGIELAGRLEHRFLRSRHRGLCGWNHLNLGELDEAEQRFHAALVDARRDGDLDQASDFLFGLGVVASNRGRLNEAEAFHTEQLAVAREAGDVEAEVEALAAVALARNQSGRLAEAEETAREAMARARGSVSEARRSNVVATLAIVRLARGDFDGARALYQEAIDLRRRGSAARTAWVELDLAGLELAAGRPDAALAAADRAEALLGPASDDALSRARLTAARAGAWIRLARRSDAEAALAVLEAEGRSLLWGPGVLGDLDLARADVLDRLGRRAEAAGLWRELAGRAELAEMRLTRLEASFRLATQRTELEPGAESSRALEVVRAEALGVGFGSLLGQPL